MTTFKLTETKKEIELNEKGTYVISFIGGLSAKNLGDFKCNLKIKNRNEFLSVQEINLKVRFHHKSRKAIQFYKFRIKKPEILEITFENLNDLSMDSSMLFFKKLFFPSKISTENIQVLIKKK